MVSSLALASRRAVEAQGGCFDEDGPFVVSQDNAWKYTAIACSSSTVDWLMTLCAGRAEFEGLVFPSTMACWLLAVSAGCWLLAAGARTRLPVPTLHLSPLRTGTGWLLPVLIHIQDVFLLSSPSSASACRLIRNSQLQRPPPHSSYRSVCAVSPGDIPPRRDQALPARAQATLEPATSPRSDMAH
jgi:hypothetical protein